MTRRIKNAIVGMVLYGNYQEMTTGSVPMVKGEPMRLIDADIIMVDLNGRADYSDMLIKDIKEYIAEQPTIEAVEVKHGRWLRGSSYPHHIFCSVCYATYIPNDEIPLWKSESYFNVPRNYCPYCGAKMDGGGDDGKG